MKKSLSSSLLIIPLVSVLNLNFITPTALANSTLTNVQNTFSDAGITTKIKAKMTTDKTLNPFKVSVTTQNGVVSLSGQVNSDTAFGQAISLAEGTDGVKDVITRDLTVKNSDTPLTDVIVTSKIKGKLIQNKLFAENTLGHWGISIETRDQVVYLKGAVKSDEVKDKIITIAESVDDVKSVKDLLKVG